MKTALPLCGILRASMIFETNGIKSFSRFVRVRRTRTAISNLGRFCWKVRLRSTVIKTSNSFSALASSSPLSKPAQSISGAVFTSWPEISLASRRSMHSSRRILKVGKDLLLCLLQKGYHLLFGNGGKPFEEVRNRVARLHVINQCLDRNTGAAKNGGSSHDV